MTKTKRAVALLFALIIILATVMGSLTNLAYGAALPGLGIKHSMKTGDPELTLGGSPGTSFATKGTYQFKVTGSGGLEIVCTKPDNGGTFRPSGTTVTKDSITMDGLVVNSNKGFTGGDKFSITFSEVQPTVKYIENDVGITVKETTARLDAAYFSTSGEYAFSVVGDEVHDVSGKVSGSVLSGSSITVKGAQVSRTDGIWRDGDSLIISIGDYSYSGDKDRPVVRNQKITRVDSTSEVSSIRKNNRVTIRLKVVDTNVDNRFYVDGVQGIALSGGAFKTDDTSTSTITHTTSENNMTTFDIVMENVIYTGKGREIEFRMWYEASHDKLNYTIPVTFNEYNFVETTTSTTPPADDKELDPLKPYIIIDSYGYGGDVVTAGQTIKLNLVFRNTSKEYALENIAMIVTLPEELSIASGSNSFFIENMPKNGTMEKTIELMVRPNATPGSHTMDIAFNFQYIASEVRKTETSKESIAIPVTQIDRFSINNIDIPGKIYVNDEYPVSVSMINKGKSPVYNVTVAMNGNMKNAGQSQFLGNIESGKENSADFFIGSLEQGEITGEIIISYEDSNMNVKTITRPVNVVVEGFGYEPPSGGIDPGIDVGPIEPVDEGVSNTKKALMMCGAVIALITAYTTVMKTKAKRSEFADEDI